jgi:hypothetical protein
MAKKSQVATAHEMTTLPMAGGDSPLVIDLPDGQKLVVGNLAAGSVIEVATWRGTGRPDSRTSRLMLGMSSGQAQPSDAAPSEAKKDSSIFAKVFGSLRALLDSIKKTRDEKKKAAPLIEKVTPAARTSEPGEVDDWLNSILEKSAKKQSIKQEDVKSVAPKKRAPAKKVVKKTAKKTVKKSTARRAR